MNNQQEYSNDNTGAMNRQYEQGHNENPNSLQSLGEGGHLHNIRGTKHIPGEEDQDPSLRNRTDYVDDNKNDEGSIFRRPQGESEYPGRTAANVVSHDQYNNLVGHNEGINNNDPYNQPNQHQQHEEGLSSTEQREAEQQREMDAADNNNNNNVLARDHEQQQPSNGGFAGVGALGSSGYPHDQLQPSRSYINESRPTTITQRPDENFGQAQQPLQQNEKNGLIGGTHDANHDGIRDDEEGDKQTLNKRNSVAGGLLDKMLGRSATKKTVASTKGSNRVSRQPSYAGTARTATRDQQQEQQPLQQGQFIEGDPNAVQSEQANHHLGLASAAGAGAGAVAVGSHYEGEGQSQHLLHHPTQTHMEGANAAGAYDGLGHQQQQQQQQMPVQQEQQYLQQQQQPLVPLNQQPHYQQGGDVIRQPSQATNRQSYINGQTGPSTGVQPAAVPAHDGFADPSRGRPVSGGGLAAAIATSGHKPTKQDKKALRTEIKDEKKYEKNLKKEAILERQEIESAAKQAKKSDKKASKSASYEASFRSTYEKAIKKEVKAKQHLLKITNEYNKIAADLERATKEMEIRRNNHLADQQTRDADQQKVEDLRHRKGQNDMDREGRHGQSLTKQNQAKRALSTSTKRHSILG